MSVHLFKLVVLVKGISKMNSTKVKGDKKGIIWLVGGSQGIGFELSRKLLEQGYELIISSRQAEREHNLLRLKQEYPLNVHLLNLDATDNQSVNCAVGFIQLKFGYLDYWIYNAGSYFPMSIDEWKFEHFKMMNDTNYLAVIQLMIALQPLFLKHGGKWIWNGSLSADFGLPYGGGYSAPKAALVNLAESLQPELKRVNIELQIINHGFVKTRLTDKNDFQMLGLMEPEVAANQIAEYVKSTRFEVRFPWRLSSILHALKWMPKSWALAITKKTLK